MEKALFEIKQLLEALKDWIRTKIEFLKTAPISEIKAELMNSGYKKLKEFSNEAKARLYITTYLIPNWEGDYEKTCKYIADIETIFDTPAETIRTYLGLQFSVLLVKEELVAEDFKNFKNPLAFNCKILYRIMEIIKPFTEEAFQSFLEFQKNTELTELSSVKFWQKKLEQKNSALLQSLHEELINFKEHQGDPEIDVSEQLKNVLEFTEDWKKERLKLMAERDMNDPAECQLVLYIDYSFLYDIQLNLNGIKSHCKYRKEELAREREEQKKQSEAKLKLDEKQGLNEKLELQGRLPVQEKLPLEVKQQAEITLQAEETESPLVIQEFRKKKDEENALRRKMLQEARLERERAKKLARAALVGSEKGQQERAHAIVKLTADKNVERAQEKRADKPAAQSLSKVSAKTAVHSELLDFEKEQLSVLSKHIKDKRDILDRLMGKYIPGTSMAVTMQEAFDLIARIPCGKISINKGSHFEIELPCTFKTWEYDDKILAFVDVPTSSGGSFTPHGAAHACQELPYIARMQWRRAFERAGITSERLDLALKSQRSQLCL